MALLLVCNVGCGDDSDTVEVGSEAGVDASSGNTNSEADTMSDQPTSEPTEQVTEPDTDVIPTDTEVTDSEPTEVTDGEPTDTEVTDTETGTSPELIDAGTETSATGEPTDLIEAGTTDGPDPVDTVEWQPTAESVGEVAIEQATLDVPLDYGNPELGTVSLAMARLKSVSPDRAGVMLFNPGGPGPGVTKDAAALMELFSPMFPTMDLVFVDNRGTGRSAPFECLTLAEIDALYEQDFGNVLQTSANAVASFQQACLDQENALVGYVNVENVARDMDSVRVALGEEKLNYWGVSYGTLQGAVYAKMFPERVRAFVIDSPAVRMPDGSPTWPERMFDFAEAYETQLNRYFEWANTDPASALFGLNEAVHEQQEASANADGGVDSGAAASDADGGLDAGTGADGGVPEDMVYDAMFAYDYIEFVLYDGVNLNGEAIPPSMMGSLAVTLLREGSWDFLAVAMVSALYEDWETFMLIAEELGLTDESEEAVHEAQAFYAVSALDWECPPEWDLDQAEALATEMIEGFPRMGMGYALGVADCMGFMVPQPEPHVITSDVEAPPMLIMGGLNDPATPYVNAVQLTQLLNNGSLLLTSSAEGHGAGFTSACGNDAVSTFIADADIGAIPSECTPEENVISASLKQVVKRGAARHRTVFDH